MSTFIITFSRVGIRDGWVEVHAKDEEIARAWARREYGHAWSSIYGDEWGPDHARYFPLGCIGSTTLHYEHAEHAS